MNRPHLAITISRVDFPSFVIFARTLTQACAIACAAVYAFDGSRQNFRAIRARNCQAFKWQDSLHIISVEIRKL